MPTKLIGSLPNQAPRNADLGTVAFMDADQVNIGGGAITLGASATQGYFQNTDISDIKPSLLLDFANGKTLDPRITFTRSTTATYYDGKTTAKAEENLLQYSQLFSNTSVWSYGGNLSSGATVAPDGTNTAFAQIPTTANTNVSLYQRYATTSGQPQAHSIYAKAGGFYIIQLRESENGGVYATFNLNAGTVVNQNGCTATITSVGNGWYRCATTFSFSSSYSRMSAYIVPNSYTSGEIPTVTGDGYSCVYYWGAQAEQRSGASAYTPTTSSPVTNYIPALQTAGSGAPRFDHDPITGESKGLLIEEQRTNILPQSSGFDTAGWSRLNCTVIPAATVAPDGTLTAQKFIPTASGNKAVYSATGVPAGTYTWSVYAKAGEMTTAYLATGTAGVYVNLLTGAFKYYYSSDTSGYSVTSASNGWYRISFTATLTSTNAIYIGAVDNNDNSLGSGTASRTYGGIYIWGAQVEAGAFPTSYIPTTSAQVTRSADYASMTGTNFSSWYNQSQGTFHTVGSANRPHGTNNFATMIATNSVYGNSGVNYGLVGINYYAEARAIGYTNSVNQFDMSTAYNTAYSTVNSSFAYATNDFAISANGAAAITDTSGQPPQGQISAYIGKLPYTDMYLCGTIKRIAYYPKRLSNAELQEMTL